MFYLFKSQLGLDQKKSLIESNQFLVLKGSKIMAIYHNGINYSYDSEDLIKELKMDIVEFGKDKEFYAWYKIIEGVKIYTNYDFILDEKPLSAQEIKPDEKVEIISGFELLAKLKKQNSPV